VVRSEKFNNNNNNNNNNTSNTVHSLRYIPTGYKRSEASTASFIHYTTTVVNPLDEGKLYRPQLGPLGQANLSPHGGRNRDL
jgi:hypothetical protein